MPRLAAIGRFARARAENVAVAMLGVMFLAFIVQIVMRYFLRMPVGWTFELSLVLWLWLVLWGASFITSERDEIRFELIQNSVGPKVRRVMAVLAALALLVLYGMSLPAVIDYVTFMQVMSTAYLDIRFDALFSIYVIFVVATLIRYVWLLWHAVRGHDQLPADALDQGPRP